MSCDIRPMSCDIRPMSRDIRPMFGDIRPMSCDLRPMFGVEFVHVNEIAGGPLRGILGYH